MSELLTRLTAGIEGADYPIVVGEDVLGLALAEWLSSRFAVVADRSVWGLHGERSGIAADAAPVYLLEPGEQSKTFAQAGALCQFFADAGLDRHGLVVALGGGVTGDLTGFAASIYMRGIKLVHAPTTLLAMVDSSVGGKTGVNLPVGKNLVGSFWHPVGTVMDVGTLATLPPAVFSDGLAEVVKMAFIRDEPLLVAVEDALATGWDAAKLHDVVTTSILDKLAVVRADVREAGERMKLNLGHTFGHALEASEGYVGASHGQAVAIGMVAAARFALARGMCTEATVERLHAVLVAAGLPVDWPLDPADLVRWMDHDKKMVGGRHRLILPVDVGTVVIVDDATEGELLAAWESVVRV